jgi:hypothetical protein
MGSDGLTRDVSNSPDALGANSVADAPTDKSADTADEAREDASPTVASSSDGAHADVAGHGANPQDAAGDEAIGSPCGSATDCAGVPGFIVCLSPGQSNCGIPCPGRHHL